MYFDNDDTSLFNARAKKDCDLKSAIQPVVSLYVKNEISKEIFIEIFGIIMAKYLDNKLTETINDYMENQFNNTIKHYFVISSYHKERG